MNQYAPNEAMQIHELLTFKDLCLTKSITMSPLATDPELKAILIEDAEKSQGHIEQLKTHMEHTNIAE